MPTAVVLGGSAGHGRAVVRRLAATVRRRSG